MRSKLLSALCAASLLLGCDGSRDQLLAHLQSTRPEERAVAVRKLADQAKPEDLVLFTRAAKDTAPIVRAEAATALGHSPDPRVVDLLGELLGDPDEDVQGRAAMALAQIKSDKAKAYLTLQYARRGRSTRHAIVEALSAANVPGAMAAVVAAESQTLWDRNIKALTDGTLPERVAAAEEIGKSGRVEAVNRLLPLVKNSQVILAAAAVRGLGYAGDTRAVEPIANLLSENFPELREAATEALLRLQDPKALPRLREIALEKSAASPLVTQAIVALPADKDTNAALCELSLVAAAEEALMAARTMRARGGCPLEPILERLGRRGDQLAALNALQGLGDLAKAAAPKVLPLLSSPDDAVRLQAISTIAELQEKAAIEPILKIHQQELDKIAQLRADWIEQALPADFAAGYDPASGAGGAENGHADLFEKIREANASKLKAAGKTSLRLAPPRELIDDATTEQLRLFATTLEALGRLDAPDALGTLKAWLDDPSVEVRTAAAVGLTSLGAEGVAAAKQALLDADRDVQGAVAMALAQRGAPGQAAIAEVLPQLAADRMPLLSALDRAGPTPAVTASLLKVFEGGGTESVVAAQLLGRIGAKEAVEPLKTALEDPNAISRREALIALGRIGDVAAAEWIARDLNHDSADVRAAAADALAGLGASPRPDALDALKGDYYRRVREAAEAALAKTAGPTESKPEG